MAELVESGKEVAPNPAKRVLGAVEGGLMIFWRSSFHRPSIGFGLGEHLCTGRLQPPRQLPVCVN